jgi:hypothetical protein
VDPSTYDSSIASAFSVRHPNFDSSSMDDGDFIRGGFLSRGPAVYTPEPGVFYRSIDMEHHHVFPSDLAYEQLTRTGYLAPRTEHEYHIPDAPIFGFSLPDDCPAVVKRGDLVYMFTEDDVAGGVVERQVSSSDTAAIFLVRGYWYPRAAPFHVSGWFHIRTGARFASIPGHATDSQRDHWYITNENEPIKRFKGFYCKLKYSAQRLLTYYSGQRGSTPGCVSSTQRARARSGARGSSCDWTCGSCCLKRVYFV